MTISFGKMLGLHNPQAKKYPNHLNDLKINFDYNSFYRERCGKIRYENQKSIMFLNCPICGHEECFVVYKATGHWHCFGQHGNCGGSVIDFLIRTENMTLKAAINHFKHELCGIPKSKNQKEEVYCLQKFEPISSSELINLNLPPLYWTVDNLLPQGLGLLASPPKFCKSWFGLGLSIRVAQGKDFLGFKTHQSRVLYLTLEDSKRRIIKRLKKVLGDEKIPEDIDFAVNANSINHGLIDDLENYLKEHSDTKLIIIDTLQMVRIGSAKNENAYTAEYRDLSILKKFADKHNICILVIHHLRKQKDNDIYNRISGTNAITGACNTIFVIEKENRYANDAQLHITGRDVEQDDLYLQFNQSNCEWISKGNAEIQRLKKERTEYSNDPIIKALRKLLDTVETDKFQCSAKELLSEFEKRCGINLDETHETIGKRLRKYKGLMLELEGIIYNPPPPHGSNGTRLHKFEKSVPPDEWAKIDAMFN